MMRLTNHIDFKPQASRYKLSYFCSQFDLLNQRVKQLAACGLWLEANHRSLEFIDKRQQLN